MIKNSGQEVQRILEETQDGIQAFLQDPPATNEAYISQDMIFDPASGDAIFHELAAPAPPDASVLYRQVVERPPVYGFAHGIVARWFDEDAQDAVLTNNLWEDIGPDHPYYGHDFEPVNTAMHSADMMVAIPSLDDAGNNTIYTYEFSNNQDPTLEITSYPNTTTLLGIKAADLATQVGTYLEDPVLFGMRAGAGDQIVSLSTIETIAAIVASEACDPYTAAIRYYLRRSVAELIAHHKTHTQEQPLNSLTLAREAQERIQTYLWLLANE